MTKKDYINKITQNLEHLTKDELKDVSILTSAQYGVRLKVAEKEYIEKEIATLENQHQPLPEVPEFVGKELYNIDFNYWIENKMTFACFTARTLNWLEQHRGDWNIEYYICKLRFGGYTVEKPQLFYIELPNVYGLKNKIFVSKVENETIVEFSNGKNYALKFTEQEIKSIDERYWQFAVPVEDGE